MNELKVWYKGVLMTVGEMHSKQTPAEVYKDCLDRMTNRTSQLEQQRLHKRWPTLGDCNRAMSEAFASMTDAERATDLEDAEAEMKWDEMWSGDNV